MRKRASKNYRENTQNGLFDTPDVIPTIPPEALLEVHAALVELLLDAAAASKSEVNDER